MGVDNVVSFHVVLANGTVVNVDACTNTDLWALRGGGGGTFGVVTHVNYKVHDVTPIVAYYWGLEGVDYLISSGQIDLLQNFVVQWLEFWVTAAPKLDNRWGGFWNHLGGYFIFSGSMDDAKSTFLDQFDGRYNNTLNKTGMGENWGAYPPSTLSTLYQGAVAFNNPNANDPTGIAYNVSLIPAYTQDEVESNPEKFMSLLFDLILINELSPINYFLGGNMQSIPTDDSAVNPAMQKALFNVATFSSAGAQKVRESYPNNVTGVCFNHHSGAEPD